jgi:hypothetical protein
MESLNCFFSCVCFSVGGSNSALIIAIIIITCVLKGVSVDTIRPIRSDLGEVGRVLAGYLKGLKQLSNLCLHTEVLALKVDQFSFSIGVNLLKELSKVIDVIDK